MKIVCSVSDIRRQNNWTVHALEVTHPALSVNGGEDLKDFTYRIDSCNRNASVSSERHHDGIYVVLEKVIENSMWSSVGACAAFFIFVLCWYALPLGLKYSDQAGKGGTDALVG